MATARGSYIASAFRARLDYSVADKSGDPTKSVVTAKVYVEMASGAKDGAWNFQAQGAIGDSSTPWSGPTTGPSTYLNGGGSALIQTYTQEYSKGTSSSTKTCYGRVGNTYAWPYSSYGWSSAQGNVTIPALTSYAVTFNANGGTGEPSTQTKYYNQSLTLSSTVPTRENYSFIGWATSASATTPDYQAGGTYTANSAVTLYAVWELAYVAPAITRFAAYRSDSSGNSDPANEQYIRASVSWSLDQTGGTNDSCSIVLKNGSTTLATLSGSGTSGTSSTTISGTFSGSSSYAITATVTDDNGLSSVATAIVGGVFKPFSMANKGKSAAFFGIANATWSNVLGVFGKIRAIGYDFQSMSSSLTSTTTNVAEKTLGNGVLFFDSLDYWVAQAVPCFDTSGQHLLLRARRRNSSNSSKVNELYVGLDTSGKPIVKVESSESKPNAKQAWFQATSGWTQVATTTGTTAQSFSDLTGYTELLVVAKYSTTYASSLLVPIAALTTTATDWYLGAWSYTSTYAAACKLTTTAITPYKVVVAGAEQGGTWTVYAR